MSKQKELSVIAESVSSRYNLPTHELKRKNYWGDPHHAMKVAFVKQCRNEGFRNPEIAEYMDYSETSVSELYNIAMTGKPKFKWQKVLDALQEGPVTKEDFPTISGHANTLRKKGYNVYSTPEGEYKLA